MTTTRPRILCADDEPTILRFLEVLLVREGYEVIKAENGEDAFEKIKQERIDLVISDVTMPKMDGFELCGRIKGDERYRDIPVIIITGLTAKEDRVKGIEAGAEDFISKPIDRAEVLARITMLLKAKAHYERSTGELLVSMGFITEQQLQEALATAKEQNIKVEDALYSMGALDKDRLYWVLSTQLNMNYVELSPEMMDEKLIKQFSIETLEQQQFSVKIAGACHVALLLAVTVCETLGCHCERSEAISVGYAFTENCCLSNFFVSRYMRQWGKFTSPLLTPRMRRL